MRVLCYVLLAVYSSLAQADSTDWISRLGGKAQRDGSGRVVAVNLRGTWVSDSDMFSLAAMPDLESLDLSHTRITDEGMLRLKVARKIRNLNLFYAEWITDQGLTAIRDWKQLKRLNLRGTRISDGTLELVSHMPGLEALDIAHTSVTDNGLDYLITLVNLKELSLGRGRLSNSSLEMLRMLPTLTHLDLSGARPAPPDMPGRTTARQAIPEASLRALAELKELRVLKLGYAAVGASELQILSALDKVEKLGLEGCRRVNDTAIAELARWPSLRFLDVQDTGVTEKGIEALRSAKPDIVVLFAPRPDAKKAAR
jgi:Leucine-rich repeat (LRR) protein